MFYLRDLGATSRLRSQKTDREGITIIPGFVITIADSTTVQGKQDVMLVAKRRGK